MSTRMAIQKFVLANPGAKIAAITAGVGIADRKATSTVGAQLHQLVTIGKLSSRKNPADKRGNLYYPTEKTGTTPRRVSPEESAERKRKNDVARQARKRADRTKRREAEPKRAPRQSPSTVLETKAFREFSIKRAATATANIKHTKHTHTETIEEFLQRGGVIERLPTSPPKIVIELDAEVFV